MDTQKWVAHELELERFRMDDPTNWDEKPKGDALISDMLVKSDRSDAEKGGGLIVEPKQRAEQEAFSKELQSTLKQAESELLAFRRVAAVNEQQQESWQRARNVVEQFRPVPWFIWRLSNYVFGRGGHCSEIPEGLVFGLRRLLFGAASDPVLGSGEKVNSVRGALNVLSPDVVAAVAVLHAVCRRLQSFQFERIWRPILDDALIRAQIGFYLGQLHTGFGAGRGMLAGFSGRSGLVILIATGTLEDARRALEMLAAGEAIKDVGVNLYKCNPLQISAMLLSACGCGREAAFGTVAYAAEDQDEVPANSEQRRWLAAYSAAELVRLGKINEVDPEDWKALNYSSGQEQEDLQALVKMLVRRGHGWNWIIS